MAVLIAQNRITPISPDQSAAAIRYKDDDVRPPVIVVPGYSVAVSHHFSTATLFEAFCFYNPCHLRQHRSTPAELHLKPYQGPSACVHLVYRL